MLHQVSALPSDFSTEFLSAEGAEFLVQTLIVAYVNKVVYVFCVHALVL